MAWIAITGVPWEYSTTPEIDDPDNAPNFAGHTLGIKTDSKGREIFAFCRMTGRTDGIGYGGLNKSYIELIDKTQLTFDNWLLYIDSDTVKMA